MIKLNHNNFKAIDFVHALEFVYISDEPIVKDLLTLLLFKQIILEKHLDEKEKEEVKYKSQENYSQNICVIEFWWNRGCSLTTKTASKIISYLKDLGHTYTCEGSVPLFANTPELKRDLEHLLAITEAAKKPCDGAVKTPESDIGFISPNPWYDDEDESDEDKDEYDEDEDEYDEDEDEDEDESDEDKFDPSVGLQELAQKMVAEETNRFLDSLVLKNFLGVPIW